MPVVAWLLHTSANISDILLAFPHRPKQPDVSAANTITLQTEKEQGRYVPPLPLPSGKQNVHRKLLQDSVDISLTSKLSPGHFQGRVAKKVLHFPGL